MSELHEAIRHIADHVQMPAAERTRLNEALEPRKAEPKPKREAKRKAA